MLLLISNNGKFSDKKHTKFSVDSLLFIRATTAIQEKYSCFCSLTMQTPTSSQRRVIYDFGANNGDDIPYYLLKADLVIAVEANPTLCRSMEQQFSTAIKDERLIIENCVIHDSNSGKVDFYIPRLGIPGLGDHHSTFIDPETLPEPFKGQDKYNCIKLPAARASDIVAKYGAPYYIKVDIEHCDADILADLFAAGVKPEYISAESHSIRVLAELVSKGCYRHFKLLDGPTVCEFYTGRIFSLKERMLLTPTDQHRHNRNVAASNQFVSISFPFGSAGPFGDDIDGEWLTADELFQALAISGLGWKDIHAKRTAEKR
jgi:FkbM family methyltransferase